MMLGCDGELSDDVAMTHIGAFPRLKRLRIQGFIVSDFAAQRDDFLRDMGAWVAAGQVKYREDVVEGIDNAVPAFIGLLEGRNFGKLLIRP